MWKLFRKLAWWHQHEWTQWNLETIEAPKLDSYGYVKGTQSIVFQSRKCTTCGYYIAETIQYVKK